MFRKALLYATRAQMVVVLLVVTVVLSTPRASRYGDNLQLALPALAWACAGSRGDGAEFFLRYLVMFTSAHTMKRTIGETPLNTRPSGGRHGFPSAHTSTAVLGASSLVHDCLKGQPVAQAVVVMAAGFVGASRIEAGAHNIWQVMGGALLGYVCDRALRRPSPQRDRTRAALHHTGVQLRRLAKLALRVVAKSVTLLSTAITRLQRSLPARSTWF